MKFRYEKIDVISEKKSEFFIEMNKMLDKSMATYVNVTQWMRDKNIGYPGEVFDRFEAVCSNINDVKALIVWAYEYKKEYQAQQHEAEQRKGFMSRVKEYLRVNNASELFFDIIFDSFEKGFVVLRPEHVQEMMQGEYGRKRLAYIMGSPAHSGIVMSDTVRNAALKKIEEAMKSGIKINVMSEDFFIFEIASLAIIYNSKNAIVKLFKEIRYSELKEEKLYEAAEFLGCQPSELRITNIMMSSEQLGKDHTRGETCYFPDVKKYKITKNARVRMAQSYMECIIKERKAFCPSVQKWIENSCNMFRKDWKAINFYDESYKLFLETGEIKDNTRLLNFFFHNVNAKLPHLTKKFFYLVKDEETFKLFSEEDQWKIIEDIIETVSDVEQYDVVHDRTEKLLENSKELKKINPNTNYFFSIKRWSVGKKDWKDVKVINDAFMSFMKDNILLLKRTENFMETAELEFTFKEDILKFIKQYHAEGEIISRDCSRDFISIITTYVNLCKKDLIDDEHLAYLKKNRGEEYIKEKNIVKKPSDDIYGVLYFPDQELVNIYIDMRFVNGAEEFIKSTFVNEISPEDSTPEARELARFLVDNKCANPERLEKIFIDKAVLASREKRNNRMKVIKELKKYSAKREKLYYSYVIPSWCYDDVYMTKVIIHFMLTGMFKDADELFNKLVRKNPYVSEEFIGKMYKEVIVKHGKNYL